MNTMSRNPKKLALELFSQFHALSRKNVITADSGRFHELQTIFQAAFNQEFKESVAKMSAAIKKKSYSAFIKEAIEIARETERYESAINIDGLLKKTEDDKNLFAESLGKYVALNSTIINVVLPSLYLMYMQNENTGSGPRRAIENSMKRFSLFLSKAWKEGKEEYSKLIEKSKAVFEADVKSIMGIWGGVRDLQLRQFVTLSVVHDPKERIFSRQKEFFDSLAGIIKS